MKNADYEVYIKVADRLINIEIAINYCIQGRFIDEDISDSLTFISFIVELEDKFNISIPDEYLQQNVLETYDDIVELIKQL